MLSFNEGPEAAEEKSDDSDSDESTISHASKVDSTGPNDKRAEGDVASGGMNQNGHGITQPGGQQITRSVSNTHLLEQIPNQQEMQYFILHGPLISKSFKFANLEIEILSKDLIIKAFVLIQNLSNTDKEFVIWQVVD